MTALTKENITVITESTSLKISDAGTSARAWALEVFEFAYSILNGTTLDSEDINVTLGGLSVNELMVKLYADCSAAKAQIKSIGLGAIATLRGSVCESVENSDLCKTLAVIENMSKTEEVVLNEFVNSLAGIIESEVEDREGNDDCED